MSGGDRHREYAVGYLSRARTCDPMSGRLVNYTLSWVRCWSKVCKKGCLKPRQKEKMTSSEIHQHVLETVNFFVLNHNSSCICWCMKTLSRVHFPVSENECIYWRTVVPWFKMGPLESLCCVLRLHVLGQQSNVTNKKQQFTFMPTCVSYDSYFQSILWF